MTPTPPANVTGTMRCGVCGRVVGYHLAPAPGRLFGRSVHLAGVIGRGVHDNRGHAALRCQAHEDEPYGAGASER